MYTTEALLDVHERAQRSLTKLLTHCRQLSDEELNRELAGGFGYPSVRLQIHHVMGAERYWIGVLEGRIDAEDDNTDYLTVESLEALRERTSSATRQYLRAASSEELNTARPMLTWGNKEQVLTSARVVLRTQTHIYSHLGQLTAMCRLLGKPVAGLDYPLT